VTVTALARLRGFGPILRMACAAAILVAGSVGGAGAATLVGIFDRDSAWGHRDPFGGRNGGLYGSFNGVEIASDSLAKCDEIGTGLSCTWKNGAVVGEDYTGAFGIGFDSGMSGTWSFAADPSRPHRPAYMAVKSPSSWALYALDGARSGTWSTAGLMTANGRRQAPVSHISFYGGAAVVPLPGAGWLLVAGLGALAQVRQRRQGFTKIRAV
jgi:hypothetical protein